MNSSQFDREEQNRKENKAVCKFSMKRTKSQVLLIALSVLIVCVTVTVALFFRVEHKHTKQLGTAEVTQQHNMIAYSTEKAVHTLLPQNQQTVTLFQNAAQDLNTYELFSQAIKAESAYIGTENFAQVGEEVLFIQSSFRSYDSSLGQLNADYILYSVQDGQEPVEIDRDVRKITCSSERSLYYEKAIDNMLHQYRYENGEITEVLDWLPGDLAMVTHCSNDDSVRAFVSAEVGEDGTYTMKNGYWYNGQLSFFDNNSDEAYFLSQDGQHLYLMEIADDLGRSIHLKYIHTTEAAPEELVASNVSEVSFYENDGSITCISDVELDDSVMNPLGTLLHFDPNSKTSTLGPQNAVALLEAADKSYSWLNENSKELLVTEQSSINCFTQPAYSDHFHYIDSEGNFCAADNKGTVTAVFPGFYSPEEYLYNSELNYLSATEEAFYWAAGDQVYRYVYGSLAAPQQLTLDEALADKIADGSSIGYVLCPAGILEQSGNTLNLKPFDGTSSTVFDSTQPLYMVGLSNDGETVYFISDDKLLAKKLQIDEEPVVLHENVYDASAVDQGLYLLTDYVDGKGSLYFMDYNGKTSKVVAESVSGIAEVAFQK